MIGLFCALGIAAWFLIGPNTQQHYIMCKKGDVDCLKKALAATGTQPQCEGSDMESNLTASMDLMKPTARGIPEQFYAHWAPLGGVDDSHQRNVKRLCPTGTCYPTRQGLLDLFHHGVDPYVGLDVGDVTDFDGYHSYAQLDAPQLIPRIVALLGGPPRFVMEVGSFIGSGIVHVWAPLAKLHPQGVVLSMDPWLGDVNMRVLPDFKERMKFKHGVPQIAVTFMRRMIHMNLTGHVVPLALPSLVGARLLELSRLTIDFIYLDSAHEHGETYVEACLFFKLLRVGGLLCGDDFKTFQAVRADVTRFTRDFGLRAHFPAKNHWCVKKKREY